MQYLSLLCQSPMPAPVIKDSAHRKWTHVSKRCQLFIRDLKIDSFRTDMSLGQTNECFRYTIFCRTAQDSRVSLCACAQIVQHDADCVARELRVCKCKPPDVGVSPCDDLAIRNGISAADIWQRIGSECPQPEGVSRPKPVEDNLLPISSQPAVFRLSFEDQEQLCGGVPLRAQLHIGRNVHSACLCHQCSLDTLLQPFEQTSGSPCHVTRDSNGSSRSHASPKTARAPDEGKASARWAA